MTIPGGTNDHPQWYDASLYPGAIAGIKAAHATWVRVDGYVNTPSNPSTLGPTGPTGQWVGYLQQAKAAGLKVLVTAQGVTDPSYPACLAAAAKSGLFDAIEIGNELDNSNPITGAQYASIVNATVPGIAAANGSVQIVVGAVANANSDGSGYNFTAAYLPAVAPAVLAQIHALSAHFYNGWIPTGPVAPSAWWGGKGVAVVAEQWTSLIRSLGYKGPWWITECGVQAMSGANASVSFATAGTWLGELFPILAGLSDAPAVIMQYQLSDQGSGTDINWGLYSDEGVTPQPARDAFAAFFAAPVPTPVPVPTPTPVPVTNYELDSADCRAQLAAAVTAIQAARTQINTATKTSGMTTKVHQALAAVDGILHTEEATVQSFLAAPLPTS
jgi:hypothetical protein